MLPMTKYLLSGLLLFALVAPAAHTQQVLPLWPHGTPEPPQTAQPETDLTKPGDRLIDGHPTIRLTNVTVPTVTVYQPQADKNTHTAALVFPGGGYRVLAWTGEGLDACKWLNHIGITCLLVKYRVPQPPGMAGHYPADHDDLEDAQQAMRLAKAHAAEWHIDPAHIGVVGFSAGGNLAVLLCNHPDDKHIQSTPAAHDIPGYTTASGSLTLTGAADARPAFAILGYPAYLIDTPESSTLNPVYAPSKDTPPTFLIQAENDKTWGRNAAVYYLALAAVGVPAELHMYATGGHGFGVHPPNKPEEHWTHLADIWLRGIGMIPANNSRASDTAKSSPGTQIPIPSPCTPPSASKTPQAGQTTDESNNNPCVP
jgi:acetyl esterase/lipase